MIFSNALSIIATGFLFATGAIIAWTIFQVILLLIRDICIVCINKKYKNYFKKPTKPKGMDFGKND